jgi:hypothetical protein
MNKEDQARHAAFKHVIEKGEFKINGEAILPVASLWKWFIDLPQNVTSNIKVVDQPVDLKKPKGKVK